MRTLVIAGILAYRTIPAGIRSIWSADSSSGKALTALRDGSPIGATLRRFALPRFTSVWEPPSWDN